MSSIPILEVMNLRAAYGRIEVLRGVDLTIPRGAVVALLGPNGAGKSTLLKVISGQLERTEGDIHMAGVDVRQAKPDELARLGLTTIPEGRSVFPNLTVEENLRLVSYAGVPAEKVLETAFGYFPRLHQRRNQLAGTMSGGEQQMLALSRALASDPALLLLDELSMGLAPLLVEQLFETVARLKQLGQTMLLVEQYLTHALRVADICYVLNKGRVEFVGEPAELRKEHALDSIYLGVGAS